MAPCAHQHGAPPAQAGSGDSGYPRPECDRRRARVDGEPLAPGACRGVHPGGRHRRDQVGPDHLAPAPQCPGQHARIAAGGAQQDRHHVGRAQLARTGSAADCLPAQRFGRRAGYLADAGAGGLGPEGPAGQGQPRRRVAQGQPAGRAGKGAGCGPDRPAPPDPAVRREQGHRGPATGYRTTGANPHP